MWSEPAAGPAARGFVARVRDSGSLTRLIRPRPIQSEGEQRERRSRIRIGRPPGEDTAEPLTDDPVGEVQPDREDQEPTAAPVGATAIAIAHDTNASTSAIHQAVALAAVANHR